MSPLTHLIGSWLVAIATTNNPRDRKLVTWAGVLPDADGLGAVADVVNSWVSQRDSDSKPKVDPSALEATLGRRAINLFKRNAIVANSISYVWTDGRNHVAVGAPA